MVNLNVYLTDTAGSETEKIRVPNPQGVSQSGEITSSDTLIANVTAIANAAAATVTGGGTLAVTNGGLNVSKYRADIEVTYSVEVPTRTEWIDIG